MKRKNNSSSEEGSVLISAAMAAGVLAILIAGFLAYMSNEYNLNFRAHRWNQAFHLAEAAAEIGIAQYNYQYTLGSNGFQSAGWTGGSGTYMMTVSNLTDAAGSQTVGSLQITATGVTGSNAQFTGVGTVTSANYGGSSLARAVQVTLAPSPMFPLGLVALSAINLNGNNIETDSYDSSDTNKSTSGQYDPNKKQGNGNIATDDTITNSVSIGNAKIYGTVSTGPNGTVTMGPNGLIDPQYNASPATTVSAAQSSGWVQNSFDTTIPDVSLPSGFSTATSLGGINANTTISGSGYYTASSINLTSTKTLEISSGNVSLYVTGNTSVGGQASIVVDAGATLKIYAAGSMSIAGNGVANNTGSADDLQFYGLPTSTSWSINGNGVWDGTVYAPEAALTLSGGGSNGDVSGAFVTQSITLNGHVAFHYDESLKKTGPIVGYLAASWQELRYVSGSWVP